MAMRSPYSHEEMKKIIDIVAKAAGKKWQETQREKIEFNIRFFVTQYLVERKKKPLPSNRENKRTSIPTPHQLSATWKQISQQCQRVLDSLGAVDGGGIDTISKDLAQDIIRNESEDICKTVDDAIRYLSRLAAITKYRAIVLKSCQQEEPFEADSSERDTVTNDLLAKLIAIWRENTSLPAGGKDFFNFIYPIMAPAGAAHSRSALSKRVERFHSPPLKTI